MNCSVLCTAPLSSRCFSFVSRCDLASAPVMLMARQFGPARDSVALGLFAAATLSLIVAITDIAVKNGAMTSAEAGPLVIAGVLSVVLFPIVASGLRGPHAASGAAPFFDHDGL